MKLYKKPEVEYITLLTEAIADVGGNPGIVSSPFEDELDYELE